MRISSSFQAISRKIVVERATKKGELELHELDSPSSYVGMGVENQNS